MWKVSAFTSNRVWVPIEVIELKEGPFTSKGALEAAKGALPVTHQHLLKHLEQEAQSSELSRDAIELWGATAQAESEQFDWAGAPRLKALEEALALYPDAAHKPSAPEKPSTLAWHDHTGVIIPLTGDEERILVEYAPDMTDENRVERLRYRYASPEYALETIFDWRGYFGRESAIVDGWRTMRSSGKGFVASLAGTFGYIAGDVLRRLARPAPTLERDPKAKTRLIQMTEKYRHVAEHCPDLSTSAPAAHDAAAVFVHGTVSCGIVALKDMYPIPAQPPGPIYRYEHDTFLRLDTNGLELAELIRRRIDAKRLLIAAHSRGGLVAQIAAHQLTMDGYRGDISIYTFGTPYLGTPLVAEGNKILNLLYKLGEDVVGAIPVAKPLTKGLFFTLNEPKLPPGIEAMHEEADGLPMIRMFGTSAKTRAWGSEFAIEQQRSGFGVVAEGALLGALRGHPQHDLVVPTASALRLGAAQGLLHCSHVHYFLEPAVQTAIGAFFAPAIAPASVAPPAPVAPSPQVAAPPRHTPVVENYPDHVVMDGVRVEKSRENPQGAAKKKSADTYARLKELRDKAGPDKLKPK